MTTQLNVKEINFNGDNLKAIQNTTGDIFAGISYVCNGLGFSKTQKDNQIEKIQTDIVLKRGCRKFPAGVFDPNNDTIALQIDFLPLWLAKISITPRMKQETPELVEKLIDYQLKAKDVLAKAFLTQPIHNSFDLTAYNQIYDKIQLITSSQSKLTQELSELREYTADTLTSIGYTLSELEETIKNNTCELCEDIEEVHCLATCNHEDITEVGERVDRLDKWFTDLDNSVYQLSINSKNSILTKAQEISIYPTPKFRKWINDRVTYLAKDRGMLTGRIRRNTYRYLTESCGFSYLKDKCNLNEILYGNWKYIKVIYALVLLGAMPSDFEEFYKLIA